MKPPRDQAFSSQGFLEAMAAIDDSLYASPPPMVAIRMNKRAYDKLRSHPEVETIQGGAVFNNFAGLILCIDPAMPDGTYQPMTRAQLEEWRRQQAMDSFLDQFVRSVKRDMDKKKSTKRAQLDARQDRLKVQQARRRRNRKRK